MKNMKTDFLTRGEGEKTKLFYQPDNERTRKREGTYSSPTRFSFLKQCLSISLFLSLSNNHHEKYSIINKLHCAPREWHFHY